MKTKSEKQSTGASKLPVRCNFFIADDVRIEHNGKPSLLGMYPDNIIVMQMPRGEKGPTPSNSAYLPGMAILANFVGAKGPYDMTVELRGPDGRSMGQTLPQKLMGNQENINFVSRFSPMPIIGLGRYEITIKLNNKPYKFRFFVQRRDIDLGSPQVKTLLPSLMAKPSIANRKSKKSSR